MQAVLDDTWGRHYPDAAPFLHWVGGKGSLLGTIAPLLPSTFQNYHEPFLGGGALFFALMRAGRIRFPFKAYLSDCNPRLIGAYDTLARQTKAVVEAVQELVAMSSKETYYAARDRFNGHPHALYDPEIVAALIYLCYTSFQGGFSQADMTRPVKIGYGSGKALPNVDRLRAAAEILRNSFVLLDHTDFAEINPGRYDLVYCDPPYDGVRIRYGLDDFGDAGQVRLAEKVRQWSDRGASVIVSNSDTARIRELYGFAAIKTIREPSGSFRLGRTELLIAAGPVSRINRYWQDAS